MKCIKFYINRKVSKTGRDETSIQMYDGKEFKTLLERLDSKTVPYIIEGLENNMVLLGYQVEIIKTEEN